MRKALISSMLAFWVVCNISYANIEEMINKNLQSAQGAVIHESASKDLPHYSRERALSEAQNLNNKDEATLKREADQKISEVRAGKGSSAESALSGAMDRKPLDGFEDHEIFKRADKIWSDPVKAMKELNIGDCKERLNNVQNQYTKRITKEKKFDEMLEEQTCEKPGGSVVCEKVLNVSCDISEECGFDAGGIEKANIASDMKFVYRYPYLTIGTIADNYWRSDCGLYERKTEFKIHDVKNVKEFRIIRVGYDDYMQIKINGVQVYNGPRGGDRLEVGWYSVIIDETNRKHGCELNTNWDFNVDIDLTPYLKEGMNTIDTNVVVAGKGEGWMIIKASQACCTKFKDQWSKRCWLE